MNVKSQHIWILIGISLMLTSGALAGTLLHNVALNQQAVQSSQAWTGGISGAAGGAVDGNKDVRFGERSCTLTKEEPDPWWRVDLQDVYNIIAVTITQRDLSESLLVGGEIWIGKSTDANDTGNVRCAVMANIPAGLTVHFSFSAIEGRYVTVLLPGSQRTLSLCEVEVFPVEYVYPFSNVALKGDVAQSSTLSFAAAARAIDGRRNSFYSSGFCSHTAEDEADPWWRVDLRRTHVVTSVKVTNRGDCCAERLDGAEIRIGNSLENNGNNNPRCASISHIRAGKTNTYRCDGGSMDGRFVNVIIPGERKTLTLCEVEVYGAPAAEPLLNVASQKPTAQAFSLSIFGPPSNAVSGCRSGELFWGGCCSETALLIHPWWRVDLLTVHKVTAVSILNRRSCCTEWLSGAEIRIGNSKPGVANPRCGAMSSTAGTFTFTFNCAGMEGRYVTVMIPRFATLSLCEVEVFASPTVPEVITPSAPTAAPPPPPPTVNVLLNGRHVTVVGKRLCWSDALFFCRHHHWDLLSLRSQEEQSQVEQLLSSSPFPLTDHVWLGLRRYLMEDAWFWMSGGAMTFTKWPQEIAPQRFSEPCGGMARGERFQWEDRPCDQLLNFICQSGPEFGAQRVYYSSTDQATSP
ncbi:hypothetical protein VZT92_017298 [Zoarces viviparus]|uniref:C-type lectin domain-containing protein n=1 Tax=Zoarces viviparus TaxID=48416 RepID=A0AAW1ERS9_ZOAVI